MRLYSSNYYQRPVFELVGVGFYFIAIASLLAVSLCGSVFYLLRIGAESTTTIVTETAVFRSPLSDNKHDKRNPNMNGEDEAILTKLDTLISDRLCATNLTCKFEKRHMPPFVQSLRKDAIEHFNQLRKSTVLVVTFNRKTSYFVAPLVHAFYRRIFADVLYCGPSLNATLFMREIDKYFDDPTLSNYFGQRYLAYQSTQPHIDGFGENNYFCFNLALKQIAIAKPYINVEGVFLLADDAIFSFWNVAFDGGKVLKLTSSYSLPFPKLVYDTETLSACNVGAELSKCNGTNPWLNWPQNYRQPTSSFYHELVEKATSSSDKVYAHCLERISKRARGSFRVLTGYSDMFYVAKRDFREALAMFELASWHKVFQEVAVPTVFACFDPATSGFIDDSGDDTNSNGVNRKSPWEAYDARRLLTHPFKLSNIVRALAGDLEARSSRMLGICLYCMLAQYSKYLSLLVLL